MKKKDIIQPQTILSSSYQKTSSALLFSTSVTNKWQDKQWYIKTFERLLFIFLVLSLLLSTVSFVKAAPMQVSQDYPISYSHSQKTIDVEKLSFSLQKIILTSTYSKETGYITVGYIDNTPIDRFLITRSAYQYFSITEQLDSNPLITLEFNVSTTWIKNQNIQQDAITLYQFNITTEKWEALPTELLYAKTGSVTYKAKTRHFGYFVISDRDYEIVEHSIIDETINQQEKEIKNNQKNVYNEEEHKKINEKELVAPSVEMPLTADEVKVQGNSIVIVLLAGIIFVGTIGGGSFYLYSQIKKDKKQTKNNSKDILALDRFDQAQIAVQKKQNEMNSHKVKQKLQEEINSLEPAIAQRFAQAMKAQGYPHQHIKETLLSHEISKEIVEKVVG